MLALYARVNILGSYAHSINLVNLKSLPIRSYSRTLTAICLWCTVRRGLLGAIQTSKAGPGVLPKTGELGAVSP